ncbi:MAG: serine/threonine-protein kinase [Gemmatimonadaceae bacterium]
MGEVYEASHADLGRHVALKVLTRPLRRPQDRERFLAEGRMAAAFNHPNSVYVFETRDVGGLSTIAMELLPGETLQDRLRRDGPMSSRDAVSAMLQVIAGLDAALTAGVLHRDIKPANCLVDRDGTVKIGDFGLSISPGLDGESPSFAGTPQFAAPEQLRGEPLDHRADIYAVGATLWYLLTGQPPFDTDSLEALLARIESHVPDGVGTADWPRSLQKVALRCLAFSRDERYQSYEELRAALRPFTKPNSHPSTLAHRVASATLDSIVMLPLAGLCLGSLLGWPSAEGRVAVVLGALLILGAYWGTLQHADGSPSLTRGWSATIRRFDATLAASRAALRLVVFLGPILVGAFVTMLVMRYPHAPRGSGPAMVIC